MGPDRQEMEGQIIDSHQHFWRPGLFDYPWMSPEVAIQYRDYLPRDLEPILKKCGVEATVLVQASDSIEETRWMLSLADQNPFIAGVVGWVDLSSPGVASQLDELVVHPKFKGVRHLVESELDENWLVQQSVLRGLGILADYKVPYDLLVHPQHLKHVNTISEHCPELNLVIDHLAKPPVARGELQGWALELRQAASNPKVHCKLSGLVTEADLDSWKPGDLQPFVEEALNIFGPERLIFGSDYPVCLRAASYFQVLETFMTLLDGLEADQKNQIFRENAIGFYQLGNTAQEI
jgi:L-fuconolactonase